MNSESHSYLTWAWLCQSFMTVLLPLGAFLKEDRLRLTSGTAEPVGVSTARGGGFLLIEDVPHGVLAGQLLLGITLVDQAIAHLGRRQVGVPPLPT